MGSILYTIAGILVAIWVISLILHVTNGLIHLLLVAAIIVFVYQLVTGRRSI